LPGGVTEPLVDSLFREMNLLASVMIALFVLATGLAFLS
jgi:hypothetical protein